jgi:asparagine synthase (glutamine-hydrolysing)
MICNFLIERGIRGPMCGIAGFITTRFRGAEILPSMLEKIARRGPDGSGSEVRSFSDWLIHLGHRRLSIIDVEGGAQPMRSSHSDSFITFNGEIFNFLDLASQLKDKGVSFKTRSDTEVLVEALSLSAEKGSDFGPVLRSLNGMFAFGFWDEKRGVLLLARDRIGIKPLYYATLSDGGIAFGSELTSILAMPKESFNRELDSQGVADIFFHDYIPAPGTIVQGIRKIGLGEYLVWRPGKNIEIKKYWSPDGIDVDAETSARPEDELSEELLNKMRVAVKRQLISDVPVGIFLSGGIDSSFVSALAVEESSSPLHTFSIGFEEKSFDESDVARKVSELLGTRHHEEILSEKKLISDLDKTLDCLDEPLGDASILPTYQVAALAKKNVKVCLGGDGGDELWAGYPFYGAHSYGDLYGRLPRIFRSGLFKPLINSLPVRDTYQSMEWKAKRFVNRFDENRLKRHFRWLAGTDVEALNKLLSHPHQPISFGRYGMDRARTLDDLLRLDLVSYLPGSVMTKVDRATMANGVEARPPFLDNEVVEFSLGVSSALKLKGKTSKYLLKKSARKLFSKELSQIVLDRPKKGFSVPMSRWIRGELRDRVRSSLESSELMKTGQFERLAFMGIFEDHTANRQDWGKTLWSFYVFDHWCRKNL